MLVAGANGLFRTIHLARVDLDTVRWNLFQRKFGKKRRRNLIFSNQDDAENYECRAADAGERDLADGDAEQSVVIHD